MKTALLATLLMWVFAVPAVAADRQESVQGLDQPVTDRANRSPGAGQSVEQKKAEIIQHIEARLTSSQAEIVCVQAAQSHDELRNCREKYRPPRPQENQNFQNRQQ